MNDLTSTLTSLSIFKTLDTADIQDFARRFEHRWYEPGEQVVSVGEPSDKAYMVAEGRLSVVLDQSTPHRVLGDIRVGEVTGETALFIPRARRGASLIAHERTACLVFDPDSLRQLYDHPAVVALELFLLHSVARRLRECNRSTEKLLSTHQVSPEPPTIEEEPLSMTSFRERLRSIFSLGSRSSNEKFSISSAPRPRPAVKPPPSDAMSGADIWRRVETLMACHPYVLGGTEPMLKIFSNCEFSWRQPGELLCREGEPGSELFFVLDGQVRVQKLGRGGTIRDLAALYAPAMLGHMSLINQSRRTATCLVGERAYVGVLGPDTYAHYIQSPTPEGSTIRRLMLSSLSQRLLDVNQRINRMLEGAPVPQEQETEELEQAMSAMEGYTTLPPQPLDQTDEDWLSPIRTRMNALQLGRNATISINTGADPRMTLSLKTLNAEAARRAIARFAAFLIAIPTPPRAVLIFQSCPSALLARPQFVSRQFRLYFPARTYDVSGDEFEVIVRFSSQNACWLS